MAAWMAPVAAVGFASLLSVAGCGAPPPDIVDPVEVEKTPVTDGEVAYPAGPYGNTIGQVIQNLQLVGRRGNTTGGALADAPANLIHLSDYYKKPGVNLLLMTVSAEWCPPCQAEQGELVPLFADYNKDNAGVAILESITENVDSSPADLATVDRWSKRFGITFDMAADPTKELGAYYINAATFPSQLIINPSDMTIVWAGNGYIPGDLKNQIDGALGN